MEKTNPDKQKSKSTHKLPKLPEESDNGEENTSEEGSHGTGVDTPATFGQKRPMHEIQDGNCRESDKVGSFSQKSPLQQHKIQDGSCEELDKTDESLMEKHHETSDHDIQTSSSRDSSPTRDRTFLTRTKIEEETILDITAGYSQSRLDSVLITPATRSRDLSPSIKERGLSVQDQYKMVRNMRNEALVMSNVENRRWEDKQSMKSDGMLKVAEESSAKSGDMGLKDGVWLDSEPRQDKKEPEENLRSSGNAKLKEDGQKDSKPREEQMTGSEETLGNSREWNGDDVTATKPRPLRVCLPFGEEYVVDADQRLIYFFDDGSSMDSSDEEDHATRPSVTSTPLSLFRRITENITEMNKGKASSRSKTPPRSETSQSSKKNVGILLPTNDKESGWKKADFTSHGITTLPHQLFRSKDVVQELLIGGNNIRFVPPDIKKLVNLVKLDISKNGIRSNSPNDYGGLPLEMQQLQNLQHLNASECNFRYIPPVIWKIPSLQYLNISRNKIHVLPPDVGNLYSLKVLNVQQTNIVTLPPEIVYCEALEEIMLWGNTMESLPETMVELTQLHTMKINNRNFAQLVVQDAYMENLLSKGQIQSEHIPAVLFEIPKLKRIDLEGCLINNIPQKCQTAVTEFYLQKNFFHNFPSAILEMANLQALNLSNNFLSSIPHAIDSLVNIEVLKFNNNKITAMPKTICKLQHLVDLRLGNNRIRMIPTDICELKNLKRLFISQNKISFLPQNICTLTSLETLDLTDNELRMLPLDMHKMAGLKTAHSYKHLEKSGLWLHKNPLTNPPEQIWKTDNPQKIWTYLRRQQIIQTKNLQRQKVIVLGDYQAGKTSLISSLVLGKSVLTKSVEDSTSVMVETRWKTKNNVEFIVIELGGDQNYKLIHPMFLDEKALYIIVYDHRSYSTMNFHKAIGQWIDMLQMHVPGAVVKIIGTQSDLCCEVFVEDNKELVVKDLENYLHEHRTKVKQVREFAKEKLNEKRKESVLEGYSANQMKSLKKRARSVLKNQLKIVSHITTTHSNEGIPDVEDIINELETMIINNNLFPNAQRIIPSHWKQFRAKLNMHPGRYVTVATAAELAETFNITEPKEIHASLHHFRDTGDIIWFPESPILKDIIFHVPGYLVELIQCLYRHDLVNYMDFNKNRVFASRGMFDRASFHQARDDFFKFGQISRPLLRCLWFYVKISYEEFADMIRLVPKLGLFYHIPQPEIPTSTNYREALVVMPWYNRDIHPKDLSDLWPDKVPQGQTEVKVTYTFCVHYPESVFEKMSVRLQEHVLSRIDWQDTLFATTEGENILIKRQLDLDTFDLQIAISIRGELESVKNLVGELYTDMKLVLSDSSGLLWVEKFEAKNSVAPLEECFPHDIIVL